VRCQLHLHPELLPVGFDPCHIYSTAILFIQVFQQVFQCYDAGDPDAVFCFHLLDCGPCATTAFLPVERDDHTGERCAARPYDVDCFTDSGAGCNDVINHQNTACQAGTNEVSAFTMHFGLLAIEAPGHIALVVVGQRDAGCGRQRYTLVGGAEKDIECHAAVDDSLSIEPSQSRQVCTGIEQAGIEKIGTGSTGFQGELAEAQDVGADGKLNKVALVIFHGQLQVVIAGRGGYHTRRVYPVRTMRIITVNVNGIRAAAKKGFFQWMTRQQADVVCLQETKAQVHQLQDTVFFPRGWHVNFHDAEKKGYSGVAIYSRRKPDRVNAGLGWPDMDAEGRFIEACFGALSIISVYLPSGSSSEERQAIKFSFMERFMPYLRTLKMKRREYILCGDWNIAHREIDLKNWRGNKKNSGFLPQERAWMDELFGPAGFVDTFRGVNQDADQYTWWSNRGQAWSKNVGWRIDYQVATPGIAETVQGARIYKTKRFSDHAPLIMDYAYEL
jgi:exodeoxyribonuclease-3